MENKIVGYYTFGIAAILTVIIFLFNSALNGIMAESCSNHGGLLCPMYKTITQQTYLSLSVVGVLVIFGLILVFSKPESKTIIKKIKEKKIEKKVDLSSFRPEEKQVYNLVKENGAIFQADLIEKTGFSKARMTRIVDKLEGRGLVERKRRGMTNVVVLKED